MTLISQAKNIWAIILDNSTDTLCDIRESRSYIEISVHRLFEVYKACCLVPLSSFDRKLPNNTNKYVTEPFILQFSCHHSYKVFNLYPILCVGWKLHVWKPYKWCNSSNNAIAYDLKVYFWPVWRHRWHKTCFDLCFKQNWGVGKQKTEQIRLNLF